MLYWNSIILPLTSTLAPLHMYKCCIEILLLLSINYIYFLLHMYKCCIEMRFLLLLFQHLPYAPHVQMLYWNKFVLAWIGKQPSSTCTNVVLKWWWRSNASIVIMLHMYKCCIEIISCNVCTLLKTLLHMYKCCIEMRRTKCWESGCFCSTYTNVVLKFWSKKIKIF